MPPRQREDIGWWSYRIPVKITNEMAMETVKRYIDEPNFITKFFNTYGVSDDSKKFITDLGANLGPYRDRIRAMIDLNPPQLVDVVAKSFVDVIDKARADKGKSISDYFTKRKEERLEYQRLLRKTINLILDEDLDPDIDGDEAKYADIGTDVNDTINDIVDEEVKKRAEVLKKSKPTEVEKKYLGETKIIEELIKLSTADVGKVTNKSYLFYTIVYDRIGEFRKRSLINKIYLDHHTAMNKHQNECIEIFTMFTKRSLYNIFVNIFNMTAKPLAQLYNNLLKSLYDVPAIDMVDETIKAIFFKLYGDIKVVLDTNSAIVNKQTKEYINTKISYINTKYDDILSSDPTTIRALTNKNKISNVLSQLESINKSIDAKDKAGTDLIYNITRFTGRCIARLMVGALNKPPALANYNPYIIKKIQT